jgi:hypothetical protein
MLAEAHRWLAGDLEGLDRALMPPVVLIAPRP